MSRTPRAGISRARRTLQTLVTVVAYLYAVGILGAVLAMRFIGERWWLTAAALYAPRVVFALPLPVLALLLMVFSLWRQLATQAVAALLLLFPLMGLQPPRPSGRKAGAPALRVLSYNVDGGALGYAGVVAEIEHYGPDVAFLQELGDPREIAERLGKSFSSVRVTGQFLVATRHRIVSEADPDKVLYDGRARSARFTQYVIETPLGPLAFYNVHPISPRQGLLALRGGGVLSKLRMGHLPTEFHAGPLRHEAGLRETQVQDFAQAASREKLPVVIAGDTNLPGLSWILNRYLSSYQDAFEHAGRGFGYTFPAGEAWMRIDRVMATGDLRFVGFEVGRSMASDHHCVVADLQRR
jgi:endonuclease/exonuclease/phosphatase (EEP) superfamily protein YafD